MPPTISTCSFAPRPTTPSVFRGLASFGAPVDAHGIEPRLFAEEGYGDRMGVKPVCIEIPTSLSGVDFDDAWRDHGGVDVDGRMVPVIGRAALLRNQARRGTPEGPRRRRLARAAPSDGRGPRAPSRRGLPPPGGSPMV